MADYNPKARRRRPAAAAGEPAAVDAVLEVVDHLPAPGREEPPVPNEALDPAPTFPDADTEGGDVASDATAAAGESAMPVSTTPAVVPVAPIGNPDTAAPTRRRRPMLVAAVIGAVVVAVVVVLAGRRRR